MLKFPFSNTEFFSESGSVTSQNQTDFANKLQITMLDSFQNSLPQKNRKNRPMRNPTGPTQHLSHRGQSAESKAKSNSPTRC
jgi:hypothetical protein